MYQSLYRRYRPQTFKEVYGQVAIATTLTNAIKYDRVGHAYLFTGPRGTGKTSMAKLLAKAVNCTNIVDGIICDKCEDCLLIKENIHPDVIEIDAASNNGVEEVRDLIDKVRYAPIRGHKKVYIIDEVHMMTGAAFNALLKTLEEPPDHVLFILATTEVHKVPNTIKSRCQRFDFKKLTEQEIIACMKNVLAKENITYEDRALAIIARLSDGGMRDALGTLEQVMIYANDAITAKATVEALDLVSDNIINDIYNSTLQGNINACLSLIEDMSAKAIDFHFVLQELLAKTMEDLVNNVNDRQFLLGFVDELDEALNKLKFDNDKKLYLELALIKTINKQDDFDPQQLVLKENIIINETLISAGDSPVVAEQLIEPQADDIDIDIEEDDAATLVETEKAASFPTQTEVETAVVNNNYPGFKTQMEQPAENTIIIDENQLSMFDDASLSAPDVEKNAASEKVTASQVSFNSANNIQQEAEIYETSTMMDNAYQALTAANSGAYEADDTSEVVEVGTVNSASAELEMPKDLADNKLDDVDAVAEPVETAAEMLVDYDDFMNILVQAKKQQLKAVKDKWQDLNKYLFNANTKKAAGLLIDSAPVAACDKAIILLCNQPANVLLINSIEYQRDLYAFTNELLGYNCYCVAIANGMWRQLKEDYIKRFENKTLPEPLPVLQQFKNMLRPSKAVIFEDVDMDDNEGLVWAQGIFSEINIKEDE